MRIQEQGKVKDVGLKVLATMLALEDLDAKIAPIRTHPLGTSAIAETLTAEVTALMGKWCHRSGGRPVI